jgi:hypothetical protein
MDRAPGRDRTKNERFVKPCVTLELRLALKHNGTTLASTRGQGRASSTLLPLGLEKDQIAGRFLIPHSS